MRLWVLIKVQFFFNVLSAITEFTSTSSTKMWEELELEFLEIKAQDFSHCLVLADLTQGHDKGGQGCNVTNILGMTKGILQYFCLSIKKRSVNILEGRYGSFNCIFWLKTFQSSANLGRRQKWILKISTLVSGIT